MTASEDLPAAKRKVRSLPVDLWPKADRNAWNAACQPSNRLKRGGLAGHLKPVTREDHTRHYGSFLDFLDRGGLLRSDDQPAVNVTVDNVNAYVAEMKDRVSSVTVYGSICRLRRTVQFIAPGRDLAWLAEIGKDLAFVMRPRSKFPRMVMTEVLVEAGLTLIHEAEASRSMSQLACACQVRNGLMIAILAFCPIRRKNFTGLEIGRSFKKVRGVWWILLTASETKEGRADERPINELLTPLVDRFLSQYRPILARTDSPPLSLWLSSRSGAPMKAGSIRSLISATTLATVGVNVSPHLFRTCAASTVAVFAGEHPNFGSALLHHTDSSVTGLYNMATSLTAAESFRQVVRQYEKK